MTFMELQNGLCQSIENGTLMRVSRFLYWNPVVIFGGLIQFDTMPITDEPQIELYVEFETVEAERIQNDLEVEDDRAVVYEGMNNDSEENFKATYEAGDKDEDSDVGVETAADNVVVHPSISQPMNVPPFMRELDLDAMHAPEFPEYSNIGVADPEDGEFRIGVEYSSRKLVVSAIRSYTIVRGVDYDVYEFEPQAFYTKCKMYGREIADLRDRRRRSQTNHDRLESSVSADATSWTGPGACAESAVNGGCANSGRYAERAESGGWTHSGPVAVVHNKESAQILHAEMGPEVQVAEVLLGPEEHTATISAYV
ncbi:hypothetical protein Ahy_A05g022927 isoform A [Arachis hypogaea]|uniref:Transposase MuDR plant domain-containing protein n=1 Tax=Arachis hypogaea TaxID=3818 RepID=A0A445D1V8_ARAHY|nr:hypothetical protein Ahy_A05g022927 isoform A [Arachis hypogaea]